MIDRVRDSSLDLIVFINKRQISDISNWIGYEVTKYLL